MTPRKITTFMGYKVFYDDELKKVIPKWWEKSTRRQRECLNSIVDHIKPINIKGSNRKDLFAIEVATAESLGMSRRMWKDVVEQCGLFEVYNANYSKTRGIAKIYTYTDKGMEFLELQDDHEQGVFDPVLEIVYGGKKELKPKSKVTSKYYKNTSWDYQIDCQLDWFRLKCFVEKERTREDGPTCDLSQASLLCKKLQQTDGNFLQLYKRIKSGRLYGMTNANLQNLPKLVRERLFAGCYDVDMVNAHYSLAYQLFTENYLEEPEYLSEYVKSRSYIRQKIAEDIGAEIGEVKTCLLVLLYGGGKKGTPDKPNPYVVEFDDEVVAEEFLSHEFVLGLDAEINDLVEAIKPDLNQILLNHKFRHPTLRSALAFKLQQIESEILDICIRLYEPEALYFDGFITKEDVDPEVLEEYVAANYDYKMSFESTLLEIVHE